MYRYDNKFMGENGLVIDGLAKKNEYGHIVGFYNAAPKQYDVDLWIRRDSPTGEPREIAVCRPHRFTQPL